MKRIFTIIVLFTFNQLIFCQISGNYSGSDNAEGGLGINLLEESLFEYNHYSDMGHFFGNGEYVIKDGKLILKFKEQNQKFYDEYYSSSYKINKTNSSTTKDSISLNLKVKYEDGNGAFGVQIKKGKKLIGYVADKDGNVLDLKGNSDIKMLKSNSEIVIRVYGIGTENYPIRIIPNENLEIDVNLSTSSNGIIENTIYEYEIIENKENQITIKKKNWIYKLKK